MLTITFSVLLSNAGMTNDEIRRENLAILIQEAGGVRSLADRVGISSAQVSQWKNASPNSKTGKPRNISTASARMLERAFNHPPGWMDASHQEKNAEPPGDAPTLPEIDTLSEATSLAAQAMGVAKGWLRLPEQDRNRILAITQQQAPEDKLFRLSHIREAMLEVLTESRDVHPHLTNEQLAELLVKKLDNWIYLPKKVKQGEINNPKEENCTTSKL